MSIQLDWDVESNLGHRAIEEDAQIIAAYKRRVRRIRYAILAGVISLALFAAMSYWRYQWVQTARLNALYAAIEAEALALRLGDKHKYMQVQGASERWRTSQRQQFDDIQSLGVDVNVTGEVLNILYRGDEAQVTVEIIVDDTPMKGIWFYEYTDEGWKHVATRQNPWVKQTVINTPFIFVYNSVQQPDIDLLNTLLRNWWADATLTTGVSAPPRLRIEINPDSEIVSWGDSSHTILIIPSQVLADSTLDDPHDPLRAQLALLLANQWADYIIPFDLIDNDLEAWERWQISLAMQHTFGLPLDSQYAFDELTPAFGPAFLSDFTSTLKISGDGLVSLRQAVINHAPATVDETYFQSVLEFLMVAGAYESGLRFDASRALLLFIDADDDRWAADFVFNDWLLGAKPETLQIHKIERFGSLLWVTTSFVYNSYWYDATLTPDTSTVTRLIAFREVNGVWKVAAPRADDWGETIVEQGEYITFSYAEIDSPYFEGWLLPEMEEIYLQAAAAFGIESPPAIEVDVIRIRNIGFDSDPTVIHPTLMSPRITGLTADLRESLRRNISTQMYYELFEYAVGGYTHTTNAYLMENTLRSWGRQRYDIEPPLNTDRLAIIEVQPTVRMLDDWDDLWWPISYSSEESNAYYWALTTIASDTFLKIIIEQCGEDIFFPLVRNIRKQPSPQAWLEASLSDGDCDTHDLSAMETLWRERFYERVRQTFGAEAFQ